jgi:hypothetical protein
VKLHRLALTHFKGVADREVTFPDSGVVVLEGANEIGKTSMIEALDLLLEEKDSSKKRQVTAMQPVGHDVASVIEVEMSSGPYRFTYRKQWFKQPSTVLTINVPRYEQLTGVAAHERVTAILRETTDLALWKALRLMQATPLIQCDLAGSTALATALDDAAGQSSDAGSEGDSLVQAAESMYTTYFTSRTGSKTSAYRAAEERLASTLQAEAAAERAMEEVQQDVDRHGLLVDDLTQCEHELEEARAERDALAEQWQRIAVLVAQAEQAERATVAARREHTREGERRDDRAQLVTGLAEHEVALAEQVGQVERLSAELAPQAEGLAAQVSRHKAALVVQENARAVAATAAGDHGHLREVADLTALTLRVQRLDALSGERALAHSRLSRLLIDKALLAKIEKAHHAVELARVEQRVGSALLTVTALANGQVLEVDGQQVTLETNETVERSLSEPFDVVVPGALRFTLQPEYGAKARADKVAALQTALTEVLRQAGADDFEAARDLHEQRRTAEAAKARAEEQQADLLDGEKIEDLRDQLQALRDSTAAYAESRPVDTPLPGNLTTAATAAAEAQAVYETARTEVTSLSATVEAVRSTVEQVRLDLTRIEVLRDARSDQLTAERARLAVARETTPDVTLEARVAESKAVLDEAEDAERGLAAQLTGEDPNSLKVRLESASTALPGRESRGQSLRDERVRIEARLEQAGSQGRQELYDSAMTEFEHAQRAHAAIDRRAQAARLLHETLQRHRTEAKRAYVEPFTKAVTRLGRVVYGADFAIEVDETLCIGARVLDGRRIEFDALSTGAKEQLAVITRLACATLIDGEQGVPVVIDDALGYSDPAKLKRICATFSLLGKGSQVVLLTCTPGRYAAIGAAEVIRL